MKRVWTLARRVWPGFLVAAGLVVATTPAEAAQGGCETPEARINLGSATIPDFLPVSGGGWIANSVVINGQPSKPNPNQGGLYQWTFAGTPLGTLADANTPQVRFNPPDVSASTQVTLRLTVTVAGCPGSDSEDITLTVTNAHDVVVNAPPHAVPSASPASATEGTLVTLDGSGSWDPENVPLSYTWAQTAGPSVTLVATANPAIKTFIAPNFTANTLLTFQLTVSDGSLTHSDVAYVNVAWTNDGPVAALACPAGGVFEVNEGQSFTFDGSASSDSDDGIASYEWQQMVGLPEVPGVATWNTAIVTFNAPQLGFEQSGLVPFKLTVTDYSGAKATADCSIFIHDITQPVISVPAGGTVVAEATSSAGANVGAAEGYVVSAFDNVDGNLPVVNYTEYFVCEPPPGALFALDAVSPVLCSAWDSAGNEATAGFSVSVVDTTKPVIAVPLSFAVEATGPDGAPADYVVKSTDIVDGEQDALCEPASGSVFPINSPGPTTTVTCNATDVHNNEADAKSFTVAVHDTTPPVFDPATVSPDLIEEATSSAGATVAFALPSANDLVDLGNVTVTCSPSSPNVFPLGETTVSCDAVDSRGNSTATHGTTATFTVTVLDRTPPTLLLPADITAEATGPSGAAVAFSVSATDAVDASVELACSANSGDTFALGTTMVTCTGTDDAGNSASGSFSITVQDTTAPAISAHGNVTAIATANSSATVNYDLPTANDLVDGVVPVICLPPSGNTFNVGSTTVNCSAQDSRGNKAYSTFAVIVSYTFNGFFQPIDNSPTLNTVKAGSAVPVKFSLGGNQGMGIFLSNPASGVIACGATEGDAIEETYTAGSSSLQFDPGSNQYIYVWKTERSWVGQCRILQVKLKDGAIKSALFKFK